MGSNNEEVRKIDILLDEYSLHHQTPVNIRLQFLFIPLFVFSLMGLITAVPFPYLAFLGKYNMFINWFSFALAIAIYYYLRLSPLLSYLMLFTFGALYFFVVQLEYVEQGGGIRLWQASLILFLVSLSALIIGNYKEKNGVPLIQFWKKVVLGPLWVWRIILRKFNLKY